jgi:hypothetical protein
MISEKVTDEYLAEILEILKQKFEGGDKSALLYAVYHCLLMKRPLPEWLRLAFLHAYEAHARFEIRTWDEVFGPPVPKSTQLEKEKLRRLIINRVWELRAKRPIDRGLFEQIGEQLDMSGSTIDSIYYDERSRSLREIYEIADSFFGNPKKK